MRLGVVLGLVLATVSLPAGAQELAEEMSCEQAVAYYEKHGVIYVIANGKFAIPLRPGTPVSRASSVQCMDRGSAPRAVTVQTRDTRRCTIAVTC